MKVNACLNCNSNYGVLVEVTFNIMTIKCSICNGRGLMMYKEEKDSVNRLKNKIIKAWNMANKKVTE